MTPKSNEPKGVIRRDTVRMVAQPAMVGSADEGQGPLCVVPLLDGDRVAGLEVRCGCGARAVVECIYPESKEPTA